MNSALAHIKEVLKAAKLEVIWDDDDREQSPNSFEKKALVSLGDIQTTQEATHFSDSISASIQIEQESPQKAFLKINAIRSDLSTRETAGVAGVIFDGVSVSENSYVENLKTYKMNFKILTITKR